MKMKTVVSRRKHGGRPETKKRVLLIVVEAGGDGEREKRGGRGRRTLGLQDGFAAKSIGTKEAGAAAGRRWFGTRY